MKLGLLGARADVGGLASLTWEFARHMKPDRILGIDLGRPNDWSRFDQSKTLVTEMHKLPRVLPGFLDGLDVVYVAETPYAYEAFDMAREKRIKTYLHVMAELYRYAREILPRADVELAPTRWMTKHFQAENLLPVPVATDRLPWKLRTQNKRFLHITAPAMEDRAGTKILMAAIPQITSEITITIQTPKGFYRGPGVPECPRNVTLNVVEGGENYWEGYADHDMLIAPRRYGGLNLSLQEALASGMGAIVLEREPELSMDAGISYIGPVTQRDVRMQGGKIPVFDVDPKTLARAIDHYARTGEESAPRLSKMSGEWAAKNSWESLLPRYREVLEGVGVT